MREACFILLATSVWAGCSGKRLHAGDEGAAGGFAGTGSGHAGSGVMSTGGGSGTSGSAGAGATAAGGAGAGGGAAAVGGGAGTLGGAGTSGGAGTLGGAGTSGGAGVAGGGGTTGGGGGGSGPTGGMGGAGGTGAAGGGSSLPLPRFSLIGPIDPSGSRQAGRQYYVVFNGASDDGSVLVGSSMFYDATTNGGVNFYWTEASGAVALVPPATPPRTISLPPNVSPDGSSVFGFYDGGVYRWTKQAGFEFFAVTLAGSGNVAFSRDGTVAWAGTDSGEFRWRSSDGLQAFRGSPVWPADGYTVGYPYLSSGSSGCGISPCLATFSDDGKVVAGYHQASSAPGPQLTQGFIWSEPGTVVELGPMPGTSACWVSALSRDGTTAFGGCQLDPYSTRTALRWTAATGMVAIGPAGDDVYYTDTTRDGRVAMGRSGPNAFSRWTAASGAVVVQPSSSTIDPASYTLAMTPGSLGDDGGSIYGRAVRTDFQPGFEEERPEDAFRWSVADGFVLLSPLPGHDIATVYAASPDGSVQVGTSRTRFGNTTSVPPKVVLWDCHGIRDIAAELAAAGIALQGSNGLSGAVRVWSGASIMIAGYGTAGGVTGAFIAWLPRRC